MMTRMIIKSALDEYAAATARIFEDRSQTVGASEVGQCSRKIFWTKMEGDETYGAARDPEHVNGWGAVTRGTVYETHFWEPALRAKYRDKLLYAGADQTTLASGCLSATPDGPLVGLPRDALAALGAPDLGKRGELVVEAKTIDPRARLDDPKPEHVFQAQVQLGLLRELTDHRPRFALISYTNASFWDDITEFVISFDPKVFTHAKQRAAAIMLARSADELKPEGYIAGGAECQRCPFTRACGRARTAVPYETDAEAEPELVAELGELARLTKRAEKRAATATAKMRGLQNKIRERLRAKGLRRVTGDGVTIVWSPVKGRPSFDIPAIRAAAAKAGVDLNQFETTGDASDRLEIRIAAKRRSDVKRK
jgi:hypothetical protein